MGREQLIRVAGILMGGEILIQLQCNRVRYAVWCILVGISFCGGCEAKKQTATLTGTVKLDGHLLDHGSVLFVPSGGEQRNSAVGDIKSDGTYLVQIGRTQELVAGEYVVEVVSREAPQESPEGGPPQPGASLTPAKYADYQTSGLRYNVRPGENIIDILLVSDPPAANETDASEAAPTEEAAPDTGADGEVEGSGAKEETVSDEKPLAEDAVPAEESPGILQ